MVLLLHIFFSEQTWASTTSKIDCLFEFAWFNPKIEKSHNCKLAKLALQANSSKR